MLPEVLRRTVSAHASNPPTRDTSTQLPLPRRELRGVVERITYQNPENGYTVARLARSAPSPLRDSPRAPRPVVGAPGSPARGVVPPGSRSTTRSMAGNSKPLRHGPPSLPPSGHEALSRLRDSSGIGPVIGGRIVEAFAENTFAVIDDTPERLTEVPGLARCGPGESPPPGSSSVIFAR